MVHTFANVDRPNAWLVYGRQNSFASWEIQGSEVVSPCKIMCSLHGFICQFLSIFMHHSLFQTEYLLTRIMVRLLTSICFPFAIITIVIFELSVVPLNKSFYHTTIQPTKVSMQTIATTKSLGGYTEGANAIFKMHKSACRLIEDHLSVINARLFHLTCNIAALRENADGYIFINPQH